MITLKQALSLVSLYQDAFNKGIYDVDGSAFQREVELRTKLAHAIASDNPPLNPNNPEDLSRVANLPLSTILSPIAEAVYKKYRKFLSEAFGIKQNLLPKKEVEFKSFVEIRDAYKKRRQELGNTGSVRSWRQEELTAFRRLCARLGKDNNLKTDYVMANFDDLDDLKINDSSTYLAQCLFETLET